MDFGKVILVAATIVAISNERVDAGIYIYLGTRNTKYVFIVFAIIDRHRELIVSCMFNRCCGKYVLFKEIFIYRTTLFGNEIFLRRPFPYDVSVVVRVDRLSLNNNSARK